MWDGTADQIPESECLGWMSLSSNEQWAIGALGYTAMKWDLYPENPRCNEEVDEEVEIQSICFWRVRITTRMHPGGLEYGHFLM